jgi:hypothetical protein
MLLRSFWRSGSKSGLKIGCESPVLWIHNYFFRIRLVNLISDPVPDPGYLLNMHF